MKSLQTTRRKLFVAIGLVLVIAVATFLFTRIAPEQQRNVREFRITTRQFSFDPSTITVKKGELVILRITSLDVVHGFGIEEYGINVQTPPGETVTVRFVADKAGTFAYFCTVFCGTGHPNHRGVLVVEP